MTRTCDCGAEFGPKNRSGSCRPCLARRLNDNPDTVARRIAGARLHHRKPEVIAASTARLAHYMANMPEEHRQRRRDRGRANAPTLIEAGKRLSPETRRENGRKRSEAAMRWCPIEWRSKYRELTSKGRRAAVAQRIVLDLIAGKPGLVMYEQQRAKLAWLPDAWRRRYGYLRTKHGAAAAVVIVKTEIETARRAAMSPFERQLERLRNGAQLVAKPDFRTPDPAYTLGGVATGML